MTLRAVFAAAMAMHAVDWAIAAGLPAVVAVAALHTRRPTGTKPRRELRERAEVAGLADGLK